VKCGCVLIIRNITIVIIYWNIFWGFGEAKPVHGPKPFHALQHTLQFLE